MFDVQPENDFDRKVRIYRMLRPLLVLLGMGIGFAWPCVKREYQGLTAPCADLLTVEEVTALAGAEQPREEVSVLEFSSDTHCAASSGDVHFEVQRTDEGPSPYYGYTGALAAFDRLTEPHTVEPVDGLGGNAVYGVTTYAADNVYTQLIVERPANGKVVLAVRFRGPVPAGHRERMIETLRRHLAQADLFFAGTGG
jgi:hypothetical protein